MKQSQKTAEKMFEIIIMHMKENSQSQSFDYISLGQIDISEYDSYNDFTKYIRENVPQRFTFKNPIQIYKCSLNMANNLQQITGSNLKVQKREENSFIICSDITDIIKIQKIIPQLRAQMQQQKIEKQICTEEEGLIQTQIQKTLRTEKANFPNESKEKLQSRRNSFRHLQDESLSDFENAQSRNLNFKKVKFDESREKPRCIPNLPLKNIIQLLRSDLEEYRTIKDQDMEKYVQIIEESLKKQIFNNEVDFSSFVSDTLKIGLHVLENQIKKTIGRLQDRSKTLLGEDKAKIQKTIEQMTAQLQMAQMLGVKAEFVIEDKLRLNEYADNMGEALKPDKQTKHMIGPQKRVSTIRNYSLYTEYELDRLVYEPVADFSIKHRDSKEGLAEQAILIAGLKSDQNTVMNQEQLLGEAVIQNMYQNSMFALQNNLKTSLPGIATIGSQWVFSFDDTDFEGIRVNQFQPRGDIRFSEIFYVLRPGPCYKTEVDTRILEKKDFKRLLRHLCHVIYSNMIKNNKVNTKQK